MTTVSKKSLLFVYGSLLSGMSADIGKQGGILIGPATIKGGLYNVGWYPGVKIKTDDEGTVLGELYEIPSEALWERLDAYEGYPYLFDKETVSATLLEDSRGILATVYTYVPDVDSSDLISSGDWKGFKND